MRRRKEVEDPDNTWNMQLMAAVINNDLIEADKLLLKGAKIDHFAAADLSKFSATHVRNTARGGLLTTVPRLVSNTEKDDSKHNKGGNINDTHSGGHPQSVMSANGPLLQFHPCMLYTPMPSTGHFPVGLEIPHRTGTLGGDGKDVTAKRPINTAHHSSTTNVVASQHQLNNERVSENTYSSVPLELDNAGNPLTPLDPNIVYISPFIAAVLSENIETAAWVAGHGGNPNEQFNFNRNGTVLHFCVRTENATLLEALLSNRLAIDQTFDIDGVDNYTKLSPVRLALHLHKPEMARIFIQYGCADPFSHLVDSRFTATQYACVMGDLQTLVTYLNAGDNIRQWDSEGQTLFHLGLFHQPIIDFLLEFTSESPGIYGNPSSPVKRPSSRSSNLNTPKSGVLSASGGGNDSKVNELESFSTSDLKITPYTLNDAYNVDGETPLIYVISHLSNFLPAGTPSWPVVVPVKGGGTDSITYLDPNPKINAQTGTMIPPQGQCPTGGAPMAAWNASLGTGLAQLLLSHITSSVAATNVEVTSPLGHGVVGPAIELVDFLLSRGADASYTCDQTVLGMSPLMHAIIAYSPEIIKRLISDFKVDINVRDKSGCTALHHAVNARNYGALELLCQQVNVDGHEKAGDKGGNQQSRTAGTPLGVSNYASASCIDLNAPDLRGETALHRAAVRNNIYSVEYLLKQPLVDVNAVDNHGNSVLHAAVEANQKEIVMILLKRSGPETTSPVEKGKKTVSIKKGHQILEPQVPLRLIVDKEDTSIYKRTPLQLAVALGHFDIAEILILIGNADVNRSSLHGTLLHDAAVLMNEKMVTILIEKGANALSRNQSDRTALHLICEKAKQHDTADIVINIVRKLLNAGCLVDDQDGINLYAPIHYACRNENVELLQVLLEEFNANPNCTDKDLRSPLHYACRGINEDFEADITRRVLPVSNIEKMKNFDDNLVVMDDSLRKVRLTESYKRRNCMIKILLAHGANLSCVDNEGKLPLHEMCNTSNYAGLVDMLLCISPVSYAKHLWAVDCRGWTPFHTAVAIGGNTECVRKLLDTYESTPHTNYSDKITGGPVSILDEARSMFDNGTLRADSFERSSIISVEETGDSALKILKKQDKEGRHPLLLCAAFGRTEIARVLVRYQSDCMKILSQPSK